MFDVVKLPVELWQLIACQLENIADLVELGMSCGYLYKCLRSDRMAFLYSRHHSSSLLVETQIKLPSNIGRFDHLMFGSWPFGPYCERAAQSLPDRMFPVVIWIRMDSSGENLERTNWWIRSSFDNHREVDIMEKAAVHVYWFDCDCHGRVQTQTYHLSCTDSNAFGEAISILSKSFVAPTMESLESELPLVQNEDTPIRGQGGILNRLRRFKCHYYIDKNYPSVFADWQDWHTFIYPVTRHRFKIILDYSYAEESSFDMTAAAGRQVTPMETWNWWNLLDKQQQSRGQLDICFSQNLRKIFRDDIEWTRQEFETYLRWFLLNLN